MSFDRDTQVNLLYKELAGTLSLAEDPAQPPSGSQASVYGYQAGNGTTLAKKHELYVKIQENGTGRPITVRRSSQSDPGKIVSPLFAQEFQERIDRAEYHAVRQAEENARNQQPPAPLPTESTDLRYIEGMFLSANPDAQWAYTQEIETQLLAIFDNQNWPNTRDALIAMLQQAGSRSQEQYGVQVTLDDLRAAEDWRKVNAPGEPSLES